MILPEQINLAKIAFMQHETDEETELQARVIKAREMYEGYVDEVLAEKTAAGLVGTEAADFEAVNLMAIALNTKVRRLNLQAIIATPPEDPEEVKAKAEELDKQNAFLKRVFTENNVDILQKDLHRWIERDGEAFLIVEYDEEKVWEDDPDGQGLPLLYIHERYTSAGAKWKDFQGSNEGCKAHYRNNDHNQQLAMVSKRWVETIYENDEPVEVQRMTLYIDRQVELAARIEKYYIDEKGEWAQYQDELDAGWPIWWTEGGGTNPEASLPLPVIHFRNEQLSPGQKKLWGIQMGMDQVFSSLLVAETMTGHQLLAAFGFYPTTDGKPAEEDGSNLMQVGPRQIIGNPNKSPREAGIEAVQPASVEPLLNGLDKLAIYASFVGGLPVANFVFSKAVASSETLRQGDAELIAQVNEIQTLHEVAWGKVFKLCRWLDSIYGSSGGEWDRTIGLQGNWAPPERRDINYLKLEAEAKRDAGVPEAQILAEVYGYERKQAQQFILEDQAETAAGVGPETKPTGGTPSGEKEPTKEPQKSA
jgi:hypothetical protein